MRKPKPAMRGLVTQETVDAARKPLGPREQTVYDRTNRSWQPAGDLGPEEILEVLVEKGWIDKTWKATPSSGLWVYQRVHNLDRGGLT